MCKAMGENLDGTLHIQKHKSRHDIHVDLPSGPGFEALSVTF
jgi:hypothetical protein